MEQSTRNLQLIELRRAGAPPAELAVRFQISRARVYQITSQNDLPRLQGRYDPARILDFILNYKVQNDGNSPTLALLCEACQISSKSVAKNILNILEKQGKIAVSSRSQHNIRIIIPGASWHPPSSSPSQSTNE